MAARQQEEEEADAAPPPGGGPEAELRQLAADAAGPSRAAEAGAPSAAVAADAAGPSRERQEPSPAAGDEEEPPLQPGGGSKAQKKDGGKKKTTCDIGDMFKIIKNRMKTEPKFRKFATLAICKLAASSPEEYGGAAEDPVSALALC